MPISDGLTKAAVNLKKNLICFHVSCLFIYLFRDLNIYLKSGSLGLFLN